MDLNQIPLFAMLKGKLSYTSQRQRLIAENVANADVPNYAPRDLKPFTFDQTMRAGADAVSMVRTAGAHMALSSAGVGAVRVPGVADGGANEAAVSPDSETRLDGNQVVLEEQMVKLSEARMDYDAAIGFYQQSLGLLKTAISKPGQ
jgi:flagellar basal-body rod protein FlgB